MGKTIGIDLGTTYSVMAYIDNGRPVVIPNFEGKPLTPSVVSFDGDGNVYVGELAVARALYDANRTVFSIKRRMGRVETMEVGDLNITPQAVSAYILRKMKGDAERYFGEPVERAVITVPAYFGEAARQATKEAGQIAGFDVMRILNEPTAACLAYGLSKDEGETVMVVDLGGGTFDVSILEFSNGVYEVRATCGDTILGGDDWTSALASHITEKCQSELGFSLSERPEMKQRIKIAAEAAKQGLTTREIVDVSLPCLEDKDRFLKSFRTSIDRRVFDEITRTILERLIAPIQSAMKDAKLTFADLNKVILVGGATRMPCVRNLLRTLSGKEPFTDIDPDLVVGLGAATQAGILTGDITETILVDVIPLSLGIETRGGIFTRLIPRNSPIPTSRNQIFTTVIDDQTEVDVHVLQGERELAEHNVSLGRFQLTDMPSLPKGVAKVEVDFTVDANGILNVVAKDVYTGNEQAVTIKMNRMDASEISRMAREASLFKENDEKAKSRVMARIEADEVINAAMESVYSLGLKDVTLDRVMGVVEECRSYYEGGDMEKLSPSIERLKALMNEIYEKSKTSKDSR